MEKAGTAALLVGTEPFEDLARLEASTEGLDELRMVLFGPVLGDVPAAKVKERAAEMAREILELLP